MKPSRDVSSIWSMGSMRATSSSSENTFSSTWGFSPLGCSLLPCSAYVVDLSYEILSPHAGWF